MRICARLLQLFLLWSVSSTEAFAPQKISNNRCNLKKQRTRNILFGISEWRDSSDCSFIAAAAANTRGEHSSSAASEAFSMMKQDDDEYNNNMNSLLPLPVRTLSILLRDAEEVTLLGEEKYFHFVTEEDVHVFQKAIDTHEGIFGMGLVREDDEGDDDDDLLDVIPIFEIQDHSTFLGKDLGIMCKAVNVGRATIQEMTMNKCILASCQEKFDDDDPVNFVLANQVAEAIEDLIAETSDLEEESSSIEIDLDDDDDDVSHVQRGMTRMQRFKRAYHAALNTDTQGYVSSFHNNNNNASSRSWKELSAISWAAFTTSEDVSQDSHFRYNALDMNCIITRLKFAMYWLSDVRTDVEESTI